MYGKVKVFLHPFLTLAPDGGKRLASCPNHFALGESVPLYPFNRRLGGPQNQRSNFYILTITNMITVQN
jgi:hypothetical protein